MTKELIEEIAKALVDRPEEVQVTAVEASEVTVFEMRVHPEDLGKLIGRDGRNVNAIRTLLVGIGTKIRKRLRLEVLGD